MFLFYFASFFSLSLENLLFFIFYFDPTVTHGHREYYFPLADAFCVRLEKERNKAHWNSFISYLAASKQFCVCVQIWWIIVHQKLAIHVVFVISSHTHTLTRAMKARGTRNSCGYIFNQSNRSTDYSFPLSISRECGLSNAFSNKSKRLLLSCHKRWLSLSINNTKFKIQVISFPHWSLILNRIY